MRVYVDYLRAFLAGAHDEAEADRVGLGHVGAHDEHAIAILKVFLECGGGSPAEGGAQTGHRCAVSYAGLVLDCHHAQVGEELLDEVVFFVVQGGPAQVRHGSGVVEEVAFLVALLESGVARFLDELSDALHRPIERIRFPTCRCRVRCKGRASACWGLTVNWKVLEPFGQSVPSLMGLRSSPSMSMILPSLTKMRWAHPPRSRGRRRQRLWRP